MNLTLFDVDPEQPTGEQLRAEGVAACLAADDAPHRGLRQLVEDVLDELIASGRVFDADDVRRALPADVQQRISPNLTPSVFSEYSRRGLIRPVGWSRSLARSRHRGSFRRWLGAAMSEPAQVPRQRRAP